MIAAIQYSKNVVSVGKAPYLESATMTVMFSATYVFPPSTDV
jgi:hypothetical protein